MIRERVVIRQDNRLQERGVRVWMVISANMRSVEGHGSRLGSGVSEGAEETVGAACA